VATQSFRLRALELNAHSADSRPKDLRTDVEALVKGRKSAKGKLAGKVHIKRQREF
jgi:hypothetical protein